MRDYLFQVKGQEILVRDTEDEQGYLKDGKGRCEDFMEAAGAKKEDTIASVVTKVRDVILKQCIDARLFGSTLPIDLGKNKTSSIRLTGPVQFSGFNRSLHRVSPQVVQGTAGFASGKQSLQKSFREDHLLPYALISAYGVVNEVAARTTGLSEEDVSLLLEGLWKGTESLISRSKIGHQPLCLMRVRYRNSRRVGDLAGRLSLVSEKEDTSIRSVEDYRVNGTRLLDGLEAVKNDIIALEVMQDDRLRFRDGDQDGSLATLAQGRGIQPQPLTFG